MTNPFEAIVEQLNRIEASLLDLTKEGRNIDAAQIQDDKDLLLSSKQASEFLNIKSSTLYSLVSKKEIPCSKRCNRLYFFKHELIVWVKKGRKKTAHEIASDSRTYISCKKSRSK